MDRLTRQACREQVIPPGECDLQLVTMSSAKPSRLHSDSVAICPREISQKVEPFATGFDSASTSVSPVSNSTSLSSE